MRALVKNRPEQGLELLDVPVPDIGPMDVLIRISRTAICGTDLHIWNWDSWAGKTIPVPMTVGHEYCGYVEKTGSGVTDLAPGDYVSGEGHLVCGRCRNCLAGRRHLCPNTEGVGVNRPGAFAEFLSLPYRNVYKLDPAIPENLAAIFDPLGNAVHTALSWDLVAEDVLITGAGPIGCMAAAVCRFAGARHVVVTDPNPFRLDLARQLGATRTVNIAQESLADVKDELDMKEGFDIGLEMSGHPSGLADILEHSSHGARISLLGIFPDKLEIDFDKVIFKGLILKGIYGREMFETWYKMSSMIRAGLDPTAVITHEFPIADFEEAFQTMLSGESGKIILNWS
ncbi:MAG: L-threonine 3-dehydrogenase [Roseibacillus sp.]|jgi:threonine 3-dehydrogenase|nr:L-threonine 3-dehydrogenase [Roseibacillus sp.]MBP36485.1 L-threonine 3-dehydrogenase [Roseibacillus sp.]MCP4732171.1 L-threonine 3-dehydrogenase [Roseibacillus sp.]MDP7495699.1 L-threonine 3-dehydrogenase [Roseibacillus sp.]MDP7655294.1 L-threonine 3-dehydrogenase [Roseibacillus sp.]|tara:strand:+ start:33437 stop:34462 length:1026 start_codon:yes stop_codon:yes gene_type:complete